MNYKRHGKFLKKIILFMQVFTSIALAAAITNAQGEKVYDTKGTLDDAERAFAQMSVKVGQKEAFLEFLGDWGMMFGPDPITAKNALGREPATVLPQKRVLYWEPYYGDVSVADDLGFNIGPWIVTDTVEKKTLGQGYFLSVWKRLPDRTWREYVDMGIRVPALTSDHKFGKSFELARQIKLAPVSNITNENRVGAWENNLSTLSKSKGFLSAYQKSLDDKTILLRFGVGLIKGKNSIESFLKTNNFSDLPIEITPLDSDISKKGDLAYSYGRYQLGSGDAVKEKGYYVHVWRRASNGEWKIAAANLSPLQNPQKN